MLIVVIEQIVHYKNKVWAIIANEATELRSGVDTAAEL